MAAAVCMCFLSPQAWGPLVDPAAIEDEIETTPDPAWLAEALPSIRAWQTARRTAHLPLWDDSAMGGVALLPTSTFRPFYPGAWIHFVVHSADLAHRLEAMLHLFLAAALLSFALRREGFGRGPAGLAALAWALCGSITTRLSPGALPVAEALIWMPLALAGAREAGRGQIRRGILYSGIACGMQLLTGAAGVAVITAYAWLGALISVRFWPGFGPMSGPTFGHHPSNHRGDSSDHDSPSDSEPVPGLLGSGLRASAGAVCLALLLGGAMWLPQAEFAQAGNPGVADESGVSAIHRGSHVESPRLFEWALPQPGVAGEGGSDYVGAGVLLFALLGMAWKSPARRGAIVAVVLAALAWCFASAGFGVIPDELVRRLSSVLPGFGSIDDLSVFMAAGALGLIAAAAVGLEALIHPRHPPATLSPPVPKSPASPESPVLQNADVAQPTAPDAPPDPVAMAEERRARTLRARGSILLTAAVAGAGWAFYMTAKFSIMTESAEWVAGARDAVAAQSRLAEGLMTVGIFAGFWAFSASLPSAARGRRIVLGVLFALMTFFWALDSARNAGFPHLEQAATPSPDSQISDGGESATGSQDSPGPGAILDLNLTRSDLERLRPLRVWNPGGYRLGSWSREAKDVERDRSGPSLSSRADVDSGIPALIGQCDRPEARNYTLLREALGEANPNFIRLFGVGVLILPPQFEPGPEFAAMLEAEFREVTSDEPGVRILVRRAPVYIREIGRKLLLDSPAAILSELARPGYNVFEATLGLFSEDIPANATRIFHTFVNRHSMDLDAEVVAAGSGEVRIEYRAKLPGIVQIAEPALPGWRAWIDGGEIPIGRSHRVDGEGGGQVDEFIRQGGTESGDLYFLNAYLPSGSHKLRLDYDPASVRLGIYMTLLGLAALAMAFGARARDFGWLATATLKPPPPPELADAPRRIRELD